MQIGSGGLAISPAFSARLDGYREPRLRRAMRRFLTELAKETDEPIKLDLVDTPGATLVVRVRHASQAVQGISEDESYTLDVTGSGGRIEAATPLGALHGLQTFLQLVAVTPEGFSAPAIHIEDKPRFPWRGLMIDSSRHFQPLSVIERNLDAMEAVKLNVLHWHLSDNQGFRVESKKFPMLQGMGSDGQFYTQADVREVIAYARDRGIRVVPEFDMPGHSTAWFVGYPQLASAPGPYEIERHFGIFDPAMDPTRETTYHFLDGFIAEMASLFPDPVFHIGGDEVTGKSWDSNPRIQAFMKAHGIESDRGLQQYFTVRVEKLVHKHHKVMEGWDEILTPNLPTDAIVQSWRGQSSLADAAHEGHRGLLSFGYYLNLMGPASQHYTVDPMADAAATLTPEEAQRILGGEACVWTEYISPENFDLRVWPRAAAIAERLWSPQTVKDVDSMYRRLDVLSARFDNDGLMIATAETKMLERAAGTSDIASLRVLAAVVEPVKGYARWQLAHETGIDPASTDPLDRLMDSVPPESETARQFAGAVNQLAAAQFHDARTESSVRTQLETWKQNDSQLEPLLRNSALLQDAAPLSADLAALGDAGLQALDYIDKREPAPQTWATQQLAIIDKAAEPRASLLLVIAPTVRRLVELSAREHPQ
jgi:hexosaminidase